jgi:REP element-mobilizing transposase RayT
MGRCIRFIPEGHLVETTLRTIHGRLLLKPTPAITRIVSGIIARAQRLSGMEVHMVVVMSNHLHCILSPRNAKQLADFMRDVGSNVAREVGKLVGWPEKFWGRRYRAIVVSNEDEAQIARLRYLLAQGYASYCTSFLFG